MNQRQLSYFLTVMQTCSIKKASEKLLISSQGLSKTIKSLEKEIQHPLFIHTKNGLTPTSYAHQLEPYAIRILNAYEDLNKGMSNNKHIFTVLCTYDFICLLSPEFIDEFYQKNPNVQLNLVEVNDETIMNRLEKNEIECAILSAPLDTTRFYGECILSAKHCLMINIQNPLSQKKKIEYTDLINEPLILKGREYTMYNNNLNRFLSAGVKPKIYMETSSDNLMTSLVYENKAIGVSLDYIAKKQENNSIIIRYFADPYCIRSLYIANSIQTSLSPIAQSFKELLIDYFQKFKK